MQYDVTIPRLNSNEDEILVADVLIAEGDRVQVGDELLVLETAKASVSLDAEREGHVRRVLVDSGDTVRVGAVALVLADTVDEPLAEVAKAPAPGEPAVAPAEVRRAGTTAKERLLRRRAQARETVRPTDARRRARRPAAPWTPDPAPSAELDFVRLARRALAAVRQPPGGALVELPADARGDGPGYAVATDAAVGPGAVIRARRVVLAEGANVAAGVFIEADDVYIGPMAKVGARTNMVSGEIVLAEGAYVGEDVEVELGGGRSADSRLLVGPASLVSPRSWINTCREVVLEEESALSPGCYVFTHRFWQSVLDGYEAVFAPVRLCRGSWAGAGCQVMAGVVLGEGSVAVSNSTVAAPVPPGAMVAGVPAAVIRDNLRRELSPKAKYEAMRDILEEFAGHLRFKGCMVDAAPLGLDVTPPDGNRRAVLLVPPDGDAGPLGPDSIVMHFGTLEDAPPDAALFDLANRRRTGPEDRLSHELRNFLRRRGIRFRPFAWDGGYKHGL